MDGKVSALSDLEYRVWRQYIHAADDFGVLPASAQALQAGNAALLNRPVRKVRAALDTLISIGLLATFSHEGVLYVWNRKWQDHQGIAWPRRTTRPVPTDLSEASKATRELFDKHTKKATTSQKVLQSSTDNLNVSEGSLRAHDARARNPNPNSKSESQSDPVWEESARETKLAVVPAFRREARPPTLVGNHAGCFFAPAACARGICIPSWLGTTWLQQYGTDREGGESEIAQVVAAALSVLPPTGPIGDPPKKFWAAVWEAAHGSSAPASGQFKSKGQLSLEAAKRVALNRMQNRGQAS